MLAHLSDHPLRSARFDTPAALPLEEGCCAPGQEHGARRERLSLLLDCGDLLLRKLLRGRDGKQALEGRKRKTDSELRTECQEKSGQRKSKRKPTEREHKNRAEDSRDMRGPLHQDKLGEEASERARTMQRATAVGDEERERARVSHLNDLGRLVVLGHQAPGHKDLALEKQAAQRHAVAHGLATQAARARH